MDKFINFIKKTYVFLLFIALESVALIYYANSNNYSRAKFLTASNNFIGALQDNMPDVKTYIGLKSKNKILRQEIVELRNQISSYQSLGLDIAPQEIPMYYYALAHVVGNSVNKQQNYLTLNSGIRESMEANMAITTMDGYAVGYILSCSDKFSVACSILNTSFKTSGKIKGQDYFGSIYWDGLSTEHVRLEELPKYAEIQKGDTIVTTNYSSIFPEGIIIGTVEDFSLGKSLTHYDVKIKLAAKMSTLTDVVVINYQDYAERQLLEKSTIIK